MLVVTVKLHRSFQTFQFTAGEETMWKPSQLKLVSPVRFTVSALAFDFIVAISVDTHGSIWRPFQLID
jgi:hypothetical protein